MFHSAVGADIVIFFSGGRGSGSAVCMDMWSSLWAEGDGGVREEVRLFDHLLNNATVCVNAEASSEQQFI